MEKSFSFVCNRCGNKNPNLIGYFNGKPYCRACISFKGRDAVFYTVYKRKTKAKINYRLTKAQYDISTKVLRNYKNNINTLIHAVCGSGKTEISFGVISYCLSKGLQVGFAVPRRDVIIDLLPRFLSAYPNRRVIAVYGGNVNVLEGDIVLLTTHQLYRYKHYFDCLILDEIDAFPFNDNLVLQNIFLTSLKGPYIMMSATPSKDVISHFSKKGFAILKLYKRFHGHPLPVPELYLNINLLLFIKLIKLMKQYLNKKKPLLIYVPTIELGEKLFSYVNLFIKNGKLVHSKCDKRNEYIEKFKRRFIPFLITTSILERGITIKDLQVIIYKADHPLFNSGVLIQIAGRVGRKFDSPIGDVIFLANKESEAIKKCINEIKEINNYEG